MIFMKSPVKPDALDAVIFISFALLSLITVFVYHNGLNDLIWIDMPNHFLGGLLIGVILVRSGVDNPKIFLILTMFLIIGWEGIELILQYYNIDKILFDETYLNKAFDIIYGLLGVGLYCSAKLKRGINLKEEKIWN